MRNKRQLYETIMTRVAREVKRALNEFGLKSGDKVRADDFDDDEVSASEINHTQNRYRLKKIIKNIMTTDLNNVNVSEIDFFKTHIDEFNDELLYTVKSKEELQHLINICAKLFGKHHILNLNWIDVSNITDMSRLFNYSDVNCDICNWDVSNVKDMSYMFCQSFFDGDLSTWDVSNVEEMHNMFAYSQNVTGLSDWDVNNVRNMEGMFMFSKFNGDISNWEISSETLTDSMFFNSAVKDIFRPIHTSNTTKDIGDA